MSISCLMLINREFEIQKGLKTWPVGDPGGGPRSHGEAARISWGKRRLELGLKN